MRPKCKPRAATSVDRCPRLRHSCRVLLSGRPARTDTCSPACQPPGERDTPRMKVQEVQRWKQVAHRRDVCITCRRHHENGGGLLAACTHQGKETGLLLDHAGYALMMHTFPPQRGQKVQEGRYARCVPPMAASPGGAPKVAQARQQSIIYVGATRTCLLGGERGLCRSA